MGREPASDLRGRRPGAITSDKLWPPALEGTPLRVSLSATLEKMASSGVFVVLDFLRLVSRRPIHLARLENEADIAFVSNLDIDRKSWTRGKWTTFRHEPNLEKSVREMTKADKALLVSFENLQHPAWVGLGKLMLNSRIPRLSFFPHSVDPHGARLPYWWNYLDWPQFPRPKATYERYGRLYSLEKLMQPIPKSRGRLNKACWIGSYISEPRSSLLRHTETTYGLDIFGTAGRPIVTNKVQVLEKYRFAVGAENSLGIGYDSEKLPEVWDAGCVPVSPIIQPLSDFNPLALNMNSPEESTRHPLLLKEPNPTPVLDYLARILR